MHVEWLEQRALLSSTLVGGLLAVTGTNGRDVISVSAAGPVLTLVDNGVTRSFRGVANLRMSGLGGNDVLHVMQSVTVPAAIFGGNGNDTLRGGRGNDYLDGGAGDDNLGGGAGADTFFGGTGRDTVTYAGRTASVTVDSLRGEAGEDGEGDTIDGSVDVVVGGSGADRFFYQGADSVTFFGGPGADVFSDGGSGGASGVILHGEAGNDFFDVAADSAEEIYAGDGDDSLGLIGGFEVVDGGAGDDNVACDGYIVRMIGGDGNDSLDANIPPGDYRGGPGTDALTFFFPDAEPVDISLNDLADDGIRSFLPSNIHSDVERIVATEDGGSRLVGGAGNETLIGGFGDDFIDGGGGEDTIEGGEGVDTLIGGPGNDTFINRTRGFDPDDPGSNADPDALVDGGTGQDAFQGDRNDEPRFRNLEFNYDPDRAAAAGTVSRTPGPVTTPLTLAAADLAAAASPAVVAAVVGGVTVTVVGPAAAPVRIRIAGDGAPQMIAVTQNGARVTVTVNGAPAGTYRIMPRSSTTVVENGEDVVKVIDGTVIDVRPGRGDDVVTLRGVTQSGQIDGGSGRDTLVGGNGPDDFYLGAAGNGADDVSGGAGTDRVFFTERTARVTMTLDNTANDGGTGEGDNVRSDIETVFGGFSADRFTGGARNATLFGAAGNDTITGGVGADVLDGSYGRDTVDGGLGADTFILNTDEGEADVYRGVTFRSDGKPVDIIRADEMDRLEQ